MAACSICGKDAGESQLTGGICDGCLAGPPAIARRPSPPIPKREPPAEADLQDGEDVLLRDGQLIVTSSRCIMPGRTFFTNAITAVETRSVQVGGVSPLSVVAAVVAVIVSVFIVAGTVLLCVFDPTYTVPGLIVSAVCVFVCLFFIYRATPTRPTAPAWAVIAFTPVGPIEVARSVDRGSCEHIATILNRATRT